MLLSCLPLMGCAGTKDARSMESLLGSTAPRTAIVQLGSANSGVYLAKMDISEDYVVTNGKSLVRFDSQAQSVRQLITYASKYYEYSLVEVRMKSGDVKNYLIVLLPGNDYECYPLKSYSDSPFTFKVTSSGLRLEQKEGSMLTYWTLLNGDVYGPQTAAAGKKPSKSFKGKSPAGKVAPALSRTGAQPKSSSQETTPHEEPVIVMPPITPSEPVMEETAPVAREAPQPEKSQPTAPTTTDPYVITID